MFFYRYSMFERIIKIYRPGLSQSWPVAVLHQMTFEMHAEYSLAIFILLLLFLHFDMCLYFHIHLRF